MIGCMFRNRNRTLFISVLDHFPALFLATTLYYMHSVHGTVYIMLAVQNLCISVCSLIVTCTCTNLLEYIYLSEISLTCHAWWHDFSVMERNFIKYWVFCIGHRGWKDCRSNVLWCLDPFAAFALDTHLFGICIMFLPFHRTFNGILLENLGQWRVCSTDRELETMNMENISINCWSPTWVNWESCGMTGVQCNIHR